MNDRASFLDELKRLSPAQFEEVMFRLSIEPWIIPGPFAAQLLRSTDLLRRLGQEEGWEGRLREVLADRTLERIGKQYEGYATEAEVRTIVSDYVNQPIAGRSQEQEQIDQFLKNNASGTLLITAPAGFGKSSLLMHWQAQETQQQDYFIAFHCFRTSSAVLRSVPNAYLHLLRQLYVYYNRGEKQFPNENGMRDILFGMVRDCGARKDKPLVIILDGLDEAEKPFDPLFSLPLPDHVYVIASARAEEEEKPAYLYNWVGIAQRLYLDRLPLYAIPKWLEKITELKPYAQNEDFSGQIYERTEGIPLFAKYLLDELVNVAKLSGKDAIYEALRNIPKGFNEYTEQQFNDLEKLEAWQRDKARQFFYFMTIAKGELSSKDMVKLMGENPPMPWQVSRWFKIRESKDGRLMYSFAHAILAQRFVLVPQIKDNADESREKLIEYCADWESHNSPYALRYYAEHLRDEAKSLKARKAEARWKQLYELARNKEYAVTQQEILPDEPDLPLETIKLALQSKAEVDEAEGMAEFLLLHAKRKLEIVQESPLDALRAGRLERAWKLAGQVSREDCILWYLLMVWALVTGSNSESDGLESARETLERLQSMQLPRLSAWKANYAVYLLGQILPMLQQDYLSLVKQVLANEKLKDLCRELIQEGKGLSNALKFVNRIAQQIRDSYGKAWALKEIAIAQVIQGSVEGAQHTLTLALSAAQQIQGSSDKAKALKNIAIAQANQGDREGAQHTLTLALSAAQQIQGSSYGGVFIAPLPSDKAKALKDIAIAQADQGDREGACTTAQQIEDLYYKAEALREIAIAQADQGDGEGALTLALSAAQQIEDSSYKVWALREIAIAQANQGDGEGACTTAQQIKDSSSKVWALREIAIAQANQGDGEGAQHTLTLALSATQQIESSSYKAEALKNIAIAQADQGDGEGAQHTLALALSATQQIESSSSKAEVLTGIAIAQVNQGDVESACTTAQQIKDSFDKAEALKDIAIAQANQGDVEGAQHTLTLALSATQQIESSSDKARALKNIAIAQANQGDVEGACTTAQQIKDSSSKVWALREIAIAQANQGDGEGAQHTLTLALSAAQQIESSSDKAEALKNIAIAQADQGDGEGAQHTLTLALPTVQQIGSSSDEARALKNIAIAQADQGDGEGAQHTLTLALSAAQQIESSSDKAEVLREIAIAQANQGDGEGAQHTLTLALSAAQQIMRKSFKAGALREIAIAQANQGDGEGAQHTLTLALSAAQQIMRKSFKAGALREIAIAQASQIDREGAQHTLTLALSTAQQIEYSYDKTKALIDIAIARADQGDGEGAQHTLTLALSVAQQIESSSHIKAGALIDIAIAQADQGDGEGAQHTLTLALSAAQQIKDSLYKAEALKNIAIAQANQGDGEGAQHTLTLALSATQQIESSSYKAKALIDIAIARADQGDGEGAQHTLTLALSATQQIESSYGKYDQAEVLKNIAIAQANQGDREGAQHTLTLALSAAQQIESSSHTKAGALIDIAIAQANQGDGEGAQHTLTLALSATQQIESSSDKAEVLTRIAIAQANQGDGEGAQHTLTTAEQILTDCNKHLPEIAATFVELGDTEHFKQLLTPCADYLDAAYTMCGHLATLYPQQATAIAQVVIPFITQSIP